MSDLLTEDRQQTFPKAFGQTGEHRKSKNIVSPLQPELYFLW